MYEGLWTAMFRSNTGNTGAGVAVLKGGRLLGGDAQYTYVGSYKATQSMNQADRVEADLEISQFNQIPGVTSVFGPLKRFRLQLKGQVQGEKIVLSGHVVEQPQATISIELTKQAPF